MTEIQTASTRARSARKVTFDTAAIWVFTLTIALAAVAFILARLTRGNLVVPPIALLGALWLVPFAYLLSALFSGAGISASLFGTQLESDTLGFMLLLAIFGTLGALAFRRLGQFRVFFVVSSIVAGIALVAQVLIWTFHA
jgi:hypothetical protein